MFLEDVVLILGTIIIPQYFDSEIQRYYYLSDPGAEYDAANRVYTSGAEPFAYSRTGNGSMGYIPPNDYYVEIRGLVPGMTYTVVERDYEMPSGYTWFSSTAWDNVASDTAGIPVIENTNTNLVQTVGFDDVQTWSDDSTNDYYTVSGTVGSFGNSYVEVSNRPDFVFTKIWKNTTDETVNWPADQSIEVSLYSTYDGAREDALVDTYTFDAVTVAEGWTASRIVLSEEDEDSAAFGVLTTFTRSGLPYRDANGNELTYYVKETSLSGYNTSYAYAFAGIDGNTTVTAKNSDTDRAANREYIINRAADSYELPSTGGNGKKLYYIPGSILICIAGAVLLRRKRTI